MIIRYEYILGIYEKRDKQWHLIQKIACNFVDLHRLSEQYRGYHMEVRAGATLPQTINIEDGEV
jgi:hypothetical protein